MRTPAFWLLTLFTLLIYPVQAGISLHQAPHLIESGLTATVAATVVSAFSFVSGMAGLGFGLMTRLLGVRAALAIVGVCLGGSAIARVGIARAPHAYLSAALFGVGVGGRLPILRHAWVDPFGRLTSGQTR